MLQTRGRKNRRRNNRSRNRDRGRTSKISLTNSEYGLGLAGSLVGVSALTQGSEMEPQTEQVPSMFIGGRGGRNVRGRSAGADSAEYILRFLEMLNTIKIYHWSTLSYPTHKATDELHSKMSELVDSFIEKYIAITGTPLFRGRDKQSIPFYECKSVEQYRKKLQDYKKFLISFNETLHEEATELLNIRDEMLGEIDQALYFLRLT
jgi:DNA-binding ferritin-like protein